MCIPLLGQRSQPHLKSLPSYVFSNELDYQSVQSLLKGIIFVRDYETTSIKCKAPDSQASRNICVKSWQPYADLSERSLTIPITVSTKAGYKLKHIDVQARWLKWQMQDPNTIKLEFNQVSRKGSTTESSADAHRSAFRLSQSWPKSSTSFENSMPTILAPEKSATSELVQRWRYLLLDF